MVCTQEKRKTATVCLQVQLKLEDRGSNELFAACPIDQVSRQQTNLTEN